MPDLDYAALGVIRKTWRDDAGVLHFEASKATDTTLDADDQIADAQWARGAMEEWFLTGGNLREQHSHIAAGKALTLEHRDDGEYVSGRVVDPVSARKVEEGVLSGLSIGIKGGRVVKDASAPGGRIVAGRIVEVSLVDRPANPMCKLTLAKAAQADGHVEFVEEMTDNRPPHRIIADAGKAALPPLKPGGPPRYPINSTADLRDAIQAIGRVKEGDRAEVIAHIKSEAKRLGRSDLVPDQWKGVDAELLKALFALFTETDLDKGETMTDPAAPVADEQTTDQPVADPPAEVVEDKPAEDAPAEPAEETADAPVEDAAETSDTDDKIAAAVKAAVAPYVAEVGSLKAELTEVRKMAAPGGPSLARSNAQAATSARVEILKATVADNKRLASSMLDQTVAAGYRQLAKEAADELEKLTAG